MLEFVTARVAWEGGALVNIQGGQVCPVQPSEVNFSCMNYDMLCAARTCQYVKVCASDKRVILTVSRLSLPAVWSPPRSSLVGSRSCREKACQSSKTKTEPFLSNKYSSI